MHKVLPCLPRIISVFPNELYDRRYLGYEIAWKLDPGK